MAEYYVVRDKNTGLYFRGKGVNRWGKYYNQASIYRIKANAENTIKEVSWRGEQAEIIPIQIVETAEDVVPKSEVEQLKRNLEQCENGYSQELHLARCKLADAESKVEKIFEEIEKALNNSVETEHFKGTWFNMSKFRQRIAELKKKYTKSEDE